MDACLATKGICNFYVIVEKLKSQCFRVGFKKYHVVCIAAGGGGGGGGGGRGRQAN